MLKRTSVSNADMRGGGNGKGGDENDKHSPPRILGQEWSSDDEISQVVLDFIAPHVGSQTRAAEVGCGGGRLAVRVAPLLRHLHCIDISPKMLQRCKAACDEAELPNASFRLLENLEGLGSVLDACGPLDFIYCFDVLVHSDLHVIHSYLQAFYAALQPGGLLFVSVADVTSEAGYERFSKQAKFTVGGFYFVCPEILRSFLSRIGFAVVTDCVNRRRRDTAQNASDFKENIYYERDYLLLCRKPDVEA
eukprot:scaffold926_cov248-Pinguiococcus_pyrenoidosus.AAC.12